MGRARDAAVVRGVLAGGDHLVEAGNVTLNKVALVGTGRLAETPSTGTPVDDLIADVQGLSAERRVLLSAGMLSIVRRAGYVPGAAGPPPAPAPAETLRSCSHGAAQALGDIFIDARLELLPEAFQLLTGARQRVPFTLLVDCLDLRERAQRDAARPVLGERGVWLAHQRAAWEWARDRVAHDPDAAELTRIWEEGRSNDRLAALTRLRDLDPALARESLASSWKQEPSELRVSFLAALARRLSKDDEEWLQTALRDRAGAVRAAAASLLARLPGSAFVLRAVSRADALLDIERRQASGVWDRVKAAVSGDESYPILRVKPPDAFNAEWEADGFSAKPPRGMGERAHWLIQSVALVDPVHWSSRAGTLPSGLARAAWTGEWGSALLIAWSRAALLHDSKEWMAALWDSWLAADVAADPQAVAIRRDLLMQLFVQMAADAAEERAMLLLRQPALTSDLDLETMLDRFDRPWSETLGARVLEAIATAAAAPPGSESSPPQLSGLIRAAGPSLPATLFDRALALTSDDAVRAITTRVSHDFDVFAHQIRLRQRLHQEIAQ